MTTATAPRSLPELVVESAARDRWTREQLDRHRRSALKRLLDHATRHSAYYREMLPPDAVDRPIEELPVLTKTKMMEHFDDIVTDPRLRIGAIDEHLAGPDGHRPFEQTFELFTTSGTTGVRGVFAYTQAELALSLAALLRGLARVGAGPGMRLVGIGSPSPMFMSRRIFSGLAANAAAPAPELSVTTPIADTVAALERFQPEALLGYPSHLALLAAEQQAGRLHIRPSVVGSGSEVLTADHAARIQAAWGVTPVNAYVTTEVCPVAFSCPAEVGMHVADDLVIVESVDADGRPVEPGSPGHRLLVTNLVNLTQPLIRYELTDSVTVAEGPNPTGMPWTRIAAVGGRTADILRFPGRSGTTVDVHPHQLRAPLASFPAVVQYQFLTAADRVRVRIVLVDGTPSRDEVAIRLRDAVQRELDATGAVGVAVDIDVVDAIEREPGGSAKLKQFKVLEPSGDDGNRTHDPLLAKQVL